MATPLNNEEQRELKTFVNKVRRSKDPLDQPKMESIQRTFPSLGNNTFSIEMARTFCANNPSAARSFLTALSQDNEPTHRQRKRSATEMTGASHSTLDDSSLDGLLNNSELDLNTPTGLVMPAKMRKTKALDAFATSIAQALQKDNSKKTVFDVVLQVIKTKLLKFPRFEILASFGLTSLVHPTKSAAIFVNAGPQLLKAYSPFLANHLVNDSNTYTALFMLSFPVWVVITTKDTVFYVPTNEEINRLALFNSMTKTFNVKRFLTAEPNFVNCNVFEASVQKDMLLAMLFTVVSLTYGALLMDQTECDIHRIVSTTDSGVYESAALEVWKKLFHIALTNIFNETANSLFVVMDSFMPGKVEGSFGLEITKELEHILSDTSGLPQLQAQPQPMGDIFAAIPLVAEVEGEASAEVEFARNSFLHAEESTTPTLPSSLPNLILSMDDSELF